MIVTKIEVGTWNQSAVLSCDRDDLYAPLSDSPAQPKVVTHKTVRYLCRRATPAEDKATVAHGISDLDLPKVLMMPG